MEESDISRMYVKFDFSFGIALEDLLSTIIL